MVVHWFLQAVGALLGGTIGALPSIAVPSWLSSSSGAIGTVFQDADSMGAWFPATLLFDVLAGLLAVTLASWLIRLARMVLSLVTLGGGSAG